MYENCKVYGPYKRKDGREHVMIYNSELKIKKTVSYPKYLMEMQLNRELDYNETIHHLDGDFTNNSFENLMVIDRKIHCSNHSQKYFYPDITILVCQVCNNPFELTGEKLKQIMRENRKKSGPFCSKSCAGKASHEPHKYLRIDLKQFVKEIN